MEIIAALRALWLRKNLMYTVQRSRSDSADTVMAYFVFKFTCLCDDEKN